MLQNHCQNSQHAEQGCKGISALPKANFLIKTRKHLGPVSNLFIFTCDKLVPVANKASDNKHMYK